MRSNITITLIIAVLAFVVFWLYGSHKVGLVFGVILLDFGVQAGHVSNQTRIYGLLPEARTVDVTTLADGQGTRYRAELNVKLPGLDDMTPDEVKKRLTQLPLTRRLPLPSKAKPSSSE